MARNHLAALLILLPFLSGCSLSDAFWNVFDGYYTEGGYTSADRRYHYEQQVEPSREMRFSP